MMAVKRPIGLWVMFSLKFPALWRSILSLWPEMTDLQPRLLPARPCWGGGTANNLAPGPCPGSPCRIGRGPSSDRAGSLGVVAADAINESSF